MKPLSAACAAWLLAVAKLIPLAALVAVGPASLAQDSLQTPENSAAWPVRVEKGDFVDAGGRPFAPRGFNYIRLFPGRSHDTFDPEHYDAAAIDRALARWQADGFNVVRVFVNSYAHLPGTLADKDAPGLAADYVRNVADFLVRAGRHGVGVVLCTESYPHVAPYRDAPRSLPVNVSAANAEYLDAGRVEAKARFLQDLVTALAAAQPGCLDAVFSYDLHNELCFHGSAPFTLDAGSVVAADGKTYALPAARQELADAAAVFFINRLAEAIRAVHPGALVSASVFTYAAVDRRGPGDFTVKQAAWQNRIPFRPLAILRSQADYLDLHFYSANVQALERDLASVEFDAVRRRAAEAGKPLLVGEFGAFKRAFAEIEPAAVWMGALAAEFRARGFAGWLYWTYDTHEQSGELWHACDADGAIYGHLKGAGRLGAP